MSLTLGCASAPSPEPQPVIQEPVQASMDEVNTYSRLAKVSFQAAQEAEDAHVVEQHLRRGMEMLETASALCAGREECSGLEQELIKELTWKVFDLQRTEVEQIEEVKVPEYLAMRNDPIQPKKQAERQWVMHRPDSLIASYYTFKFALPRIEELITSRGYDVAEIFGKGAQESNWKLQAGSHAGARGPLQFIAFTGRKYGLTVNGSTDERFTLVEATRAALNYLDELKKLFDGDIELAYAGYNCGENCQRGILFRADSFEDIRNRLNRETAAHPYYIRAAAEFYRSVEQNQSFYNIRIHDIEDNSFQNIVLKDDLSLREVTFLMENPEWLPWGWLQIMRLMNDEYGMKPDDILPAGTTLRMPTIAVDAYEQRLADQINSEFILETRPRFDTYIVRPGDTLGRIASRYRDCSWRAIANENNMRSTRIYPGQELKVPCLSR